MQSNNTQEKTMAVINPFASNDPEGSIWEEGFLAGFAQPDQDHFRPFSPNLLEVFDEGVTAGRNARHAPPPQGSFWAGADEVVEEQARSFLIDKLLEHVIPKLGGLIGLLIDVVQIQGDTPLVPLPEDFNRVLGQNDFQDDPRYVAVCLRNDHPAVSQGVRSDGTWSGSSHTEFADAIVDMTAHEHAEAFVARCSLRDRTCGAVWAAKQA
jgi:hypothetical protein